MPAPGEARRLLEGKIEAIRQRLQPAIDSGEYVVPEATDEEVVAMLHARLEESRIRNEENEKRFATRRWGVGYGP